MIKQTDYPNIHWLPKEQYQQAVTQVRLQIGSILFPLRKYGQDYYVDGAIDEITKLCEDFGLRVRGADHPICTPDSQADNSYHDDGWY